MGTGEKCIGANVLEAFAREVFERLGMPSGDAAIEAEVLVWANLHGVDSHGVLRIPWYASLVEQGLMNPRPQITVARETPAVAFIEADRAFGPVVTKRAMEIVIDKASTVGIGWSLIRNLTHQGAMAFYTLMAARRGLAGIAIVCSPPNMAPWGARAAGLHNSPISIAVPAGRHEKLVLDMATSVAAGGKLRLAVDQGVPIPPGWALDRDGLPTTDASLADILLPAGAYKGSGLAMMFESLTSVMAGNPLVTPVLTGASARGRHNQNSVVAAIDVGLFTELDAYRARIDALIDAVRALPAADGTEAVRVPGEPEERIRAQRAAHGIPLPLDTAANLREVAGRLGVAVPAELAA